MLEQPSEQLAGGGAVGRGLEGALDLAQDLGLAQDHGIEAAGDPQQVDHRVAAGVGVEEGVDPLVLDAVKAAEPVANRLLAPIFDGAVEFGAVAGGHDHRFMHTLASPQVAQCPGNDVWPEGEALAHLDRGRLVVESDDQ